MTIFDLISPLCTQLFQTGPHVTCLTADPGVVSLIPAGSHTFIEIDHKIILQPFSSLPLIQEGLLSVTSNSIFMNYWLTA